MIIVGFGYNVLQSDLKTFDRKFFAFEADISSDEFDELENSVQTRDEYDLAFGEAASIGTKDCCDMFSNFNTPSNAFLWADYNVVVLDKDIIKGCEKFREFFKKKKIKCSKITEFTSY